MKILLHYWIQCEIEQISAAFTSTCSSKVTLCLKIIYWDRNKSFKVIRMSIEDYYLVSIKNFTSIMQNLGALKHLNKWTETGCTLNRMWYASLTMKRIHQLGLWQMHIFRSNASIFVDFIWLIFGVKFIEISENEIESKVQKQSYSDLRGSTTLNRLIFQLCFIVLKIKLYVCRILCENFIQIGQKMKKS